MVLRLLVIQHLHAWSYEQVEPFVGDSLVLRQFCRLGLEPMPHHTTVMRWANLPQPARNSVAQCRGLVRLTA